MKKAGKTRVLPALDKAEMMPPKQQRGRRYTPQF